MKFAALIVTVYGLMVALGGLVGYLTADSLPSLIMGSIAGAGLFASGLGLYRSSILAFFTAIIITLMLGIFFAFRYYLTHQMMPAGMMGLLSFIIFVLLLTSKGRPKKTLPK